MTAPKTIQELQLFVELIHINVMRGSNADFAYIENQKSAEQFFASDPSIHVARQLATEVERHIRGGKTYYQAILTMVNDGWATRLIEATPLEYRELGLPH